MNAAETAYRAAQQAIAKAKKEGSFILELSEPKFHALATLPPEIGSLTRLTNLYLSDTQVSDLAPLSKMTGLTHLFLSNTQVNDLAPLSKMTGLTYLNLSNTQVSDLAPLSKMTGLTYLNLCDTQVSDLGPLSEMTRLTDLGLSNTQVSDLAPLYKMTELTTLDLSNTQVSDLAPLYKMAGLKRLALSNTQVSDLGPLSDKSDLRLLYLTNSPVLDLRPLRKALSGASGKNFELRIAGTIAAQDPAIALIAALEVQTDRAVALDKVLGDGWEPGGRLSPDAPFVFVSYASLNRPKIASHHRFLAAQSIPLWWDQDIPGGDAWRGTVAARLKAARAVVTFWTAESVVSQAVIEEADTAQRAGRLVHVRLDDAELPYGFGETQYIDLRGWDGSAQHPQMAKLLQALRDRLNPPDAATQSARLAAASDVGMQPVAGQLQPVDTPMNTRPEAENALDLAARLDGLRQTLAGLSVMVSSGQFQFPLDLGFALSSVHGALHAERLSWYGIDDARAVLADCMAEHDAKGSWNGVALTSSTRLVNGMAALRPLLQPSQVPDGEPGAKPPAPDPVVRAADLPQVKGIAQEITAAATSPEGEAILTPDAKDLLQRDVALINSGAQIADPDRRAPKLRRAVRGLIYTTGAIITALSTETVASLLTAPEAAATLLMRLQQVYDMLLKFFL